MAVTKKLKLTQFGNPVLRQRAKSVLVKNIAGTKIQTLIANMFATVSGVGVGLAAPQIGQSLQLAVIEVKKTINRKDVVPFPKTVIINPKIVSYSKDQELGWEGCLSCSDDTGRALLWGQVPRAKRIVVKYYDEQGSVHTETHSDFIARVFQHEVDHLNGFVFVDRMKDMKTLATSGGMKQARKAKK